MPLLTSDREREAQPIQGLNKRRELLFHVEQRACGVRWLLFAPRSLTNEHVRGAHPARLGAANSR